MAKEEQISPYFKLSEFNRNLSKWGRWVRPDPVLLAVLQKVREYTGEPLEITGGARSIEDHIKVYKSIAKRTGSKWEECIKWSSRHLPSHQHPDLRAVDFKCRKGKGYYSGIEVKTIIRQITGALSFEELYGVNYWGLGVGKEYVHLDTGDRTFDSEWAYDY